jgi:uncharacterized protein
MTAVAHKMDEAEAAGQRPGGSGSRHRRDDGGSGSRQRRDDAGSGSRQRRCILSGEVMPGDRLIRFVAAPDGQVVPDIGDKLPGRGLWVTATRDAVLAAAKKNVFARAAKAHVTAGSDLADRTERALVSRMLGDLGLARRSGALLLGFDNILRALEGPRPPAVMIEAGDGSADGKRKLYNAAHARGLKPEVVEGLTSAELGLALGRENVIHAAVQPGGLAERLICDGKRLRGFRTAMPAGSERDL